MPGATGSRRVAVLYNILVMPNASTLAHRLQHVRRRLAELPGLALHGSFRSGTRRRHSSVICDEMQELGGRILPAKRGGHSTRFLEQLREEALAPLWPDPEDPTTVDASDAMPVRCSKSPHFLRICKYLAPIMMHQS